MAEQSGEWLEGLGRKVWTAVPHHQPLPSLPSLRSAARSRTLAGGVELRRALDEVDPNSHTTHPWIVESALYNCVSYHHIDIAELLIPPSRTPHHRMDRRTRVAGR